MNCIKIVLKEASRHKHVNCMNPNNHPGLTNRSNKCMFGDTRVALTREGGRGFRRHIEVFV